MHRKKVFFAVMLVGMLGFFSQSALAAQEQEGEAAQPAPGDSQRQRDLINASLAAGDQEKAIRELEGVVTSRKKFDDIKDWAATELWRLAKAQGQLPQVIEDLEKSAAKEPQDIYLKKVICEGYVRENNWNKAASIYEELVKDDPRDAALSRRLLDYYLLANNFDKVLEALEPQVEQDPGNIQRSDMLLNVYAKAGMQDKAIALFKKRLDAEPNSPGLRGRYAQALQGFGQLQEALKEWEKARELDPRNLTFQQRVAEIYASLGDYSQARREYQRLLDAAPENQPWFKNTALAGLEALKDK